MQPPTGFQRRNQREHYRRVLIMVEHAADVASTKGMKTEVQKAAVIALLRSQITAQRLLLDELDRQDTDATGIEDNLDFETDLRIMLDAAEKEEGTTS